MDRRSSAVWRGPAEKIENTPSGNCVIGASPPPPATARVPERSNGLLRQASNTRIAVRAPLVLQPLDDAVGENGGVAHQFFLSLGRRRHIGRQQEILAGDLKAVAGKEEERGVALLDRLVEGEQRLAEGLPVSGSPRPSP